jgi:hypothetical protein
MRRVGEYGAKFPLFGTTALLALAGDSFKRGDTWLVEEKDAFSVSFEGIGGASVCCSRVLTAVETAGTKAFSSGNFVTDWFEMLARTREAIVSLSTAVSAKVVVLVVVEIVVLIVVVGSVVLAFIISGVTEVRSGCRELCFNLWISVGVDNGAL